MKLDHILTEVDRAAVRKQSKRTMGLSTPHNRHAKRQQSKAARRYDIDTEDYGKDTPEQMSDAPYVVGYSAQGREWRGNGSVESGDGRWKMYDDGKVVAINVPDYSTAEKIVADLDASYEDGTFPDEFMYSEPGSEYGTDYYGAWITPSKDFEDEWMFQHDKPKDYSTT